MIGRSSLRKKRYGKSNWGATFLHNFLVDVVRKQRASTKAEIARTKRTRESVRAASASTSRQREVERTKADRQMQAAAEREEKYLAWSRLLCLKHGIPQECAEFIARQGMDLHASKAELESVIIAKQDWKSFDWNAARHGNGSRAQADRQSTERSEQVTRALAAAVKKSSVREAALHDEKNTGRGGRWMAFWATLLFAFWGIHLMITSSYAWYWFILMLLPFIAIQQTESEQEVPIGYGREPESRTGRAAKSLVFVSAVAVACLGVGLMIKSDAAWYWFTPLVIPSLILLPGRMKRWENEDQEKKRRKLERNARG